MSASLVSILRQPSDAKTAAVGVSEPHAAQPSDDAAGDPDAIIAEGLRVALRVMLSRFPGLQEADAQDLTQELAVEYWLHRETVQAPAAWFRACAIRKAQRFLSRRRFNDTLDSAAMTPAPADAICEYAIQQIFFTMQNRCRRLLGLVVIAGCRPEELAVSGDRTARSIYQNTARCLKTMRSRWLRVTALQQAQEQTSS